MSLVDSFSLADYSTKEEIEELLQAIEYEQSTLRGFERGAREKLAALEGQDVPRFRVKQRSIFVKTNCYPSERQS